MTDTKELNAAIARMGMTSCSRVGTVSSRVLEETI